MNDARHRGLHRRRPCPTDLETALAVAPRARRRTFVMVTAEMLPTAVLPEMSAGLGVSEGRRACSSRCGRRSWSSAASRSCASRSASTGAPSSSGARRLAASVALTALAPDYPSPSPGDSWGRSRSGCSGPRRTPTPPTSSPTAISPGRRRGARRRDARHGHRHAAREPRRAGHGVARDVLGPRGRRPGRRGAGAHDRALAECGCRGTGRLVDGCLAHIVTG